MIMTWKRNYNLKYAANKLTQQNFLWWILLEFSWQNWKLHGGSHGNKIGNIINIQKTKDDVAVISHLINFKTKNWKIFAMKSRSLVLILDQEFWMKFQTNTANIRNILSKIEVLLIIIKLSVNNLSTTNIYEFLDIGSKLNSNQSGFRPNNSYTNL